MKLRQLQAAFWFVAACAAAFGDTLVVPNTQATASGNSPLRAGTNPIRIQEIVGSGQFTVPITIIALRIRSFPGAGPVNLGSVTSLQLTLSTTQAYPNTNNGHTLPSLTYANNVGPDAKMVFNGAFSGSSPGCLTPGPCPFDMVIPFATPFSYDPSKGRLLIDLITSAPTGTVVGSLDGVGFADSTSSSVVIVSGDPTKPTGNLNLGGIVYGLDTVSASAQTPTVGGVLNAADFSSHLCPGVVAAIYGINFGTTASAVTVTVGGKAGYVANVTANQINAQLPTDAAAGPTTITVTVGGVTSAPLNITLDAYAPALFSADGSGTGAALITTPGGAKLTTTAPAKPGDTLLAYAIGLGLTNPATPTGPAKAANPTATAPTLTVGGANATILFAGAAPGQPGLYQINFKVPTGVQGTVPVVISIGGKSSGSLALALFGISSIVSNASFGSAGTAAPGSIVSVFANGLGTTDQTTGFPGTVFQGVSVSFNGTLAPMFHLTATQGQIDLLVPFELPATGTVNVQLMTAAGPTPNYAFKMAAAAPGMYFLADPSTKTRFNAIAQFNNTVWLAMPASMATALKIPGNCTASSFNPLSLCGQPAAPSDFLVLYATGLGKATPKGDPNGATIKTGTVAPADGSVLYQTVATPTVTVAGSPATVLFSGLSPGFAGLYQIDFQVPTGVTGDDLPLVVSMGGATDTRTISVRLR